MNPFLFATVLLILLFNPLKGWSQIGVSPGDPIHPLSLLADPSDINPYLLVSYTSPFGIPSLSNFGIKLNQPVSQGLLVVDADMIGIPGYYQYYFGVAYCLIPGPGMLLGLNLNAVLNAALESDPRKLSLGSSFFGAINFQSSIQSCIYFDNWTGLWNSPDKPSQKPRLSASLKAKTNSDVVLVSGITYAKSCRPLIRLGISILAGSSHTIVAGMQTGPVGFWTGYRYSQKKLDFLFTLQAGGVFGFEPGTSFKYLFQ